VRRGVAVHSPDDESHLALDHLQVGRVSADHGQVASPLIVQTKVLAEALGAEKLETLGDEISDGPGVSVQTSGGKALVSTVKEREELLLSTNISDLSPLLLGRVNTGRVMSASVEDYDRISWSGLQILTETGKVQTLALRIPV